MTTLIGESLPRPDALGKVTGAANYPGDLVRPGMLHLKVVFAHRPHARILAIDTTAALAHPGVVATSAREGTGIARLRAALALLATPAREARR